MSLKAKYQDNATTTAMLMDAGITIMRQNIIRRHPQNSKRQTDAMLKVWLYRADAQIPGDVAGNVRIRSQKQL